MLWPIMKILPKYREPNIYVDEAVKLDVCSQLSSQKIKSYNATIDNISPDSYEENTREERFSVIIKVCIRC